GLLLVTNLEALIVRHVRWYSATLYMKQYSLLAAELTSKALNRCSLTANDDKKDDELKDSDMGTAGDGKVINILTGDLHNILYVADACLSLLQTPINLCIGIWYLYRLLGISAIIGLTISGLQYPLNRYLVKFTVPYWKKQYAINDERIALITEMFKGIRAIKLFGWQSRFANKVRSKREEQLQQLWSMETFLIGINFLTSLVSSLTFISILGIYSGVYGNTLTADVIFTSMTLANIVDGEIGSLQNEIGDIISSFISIRRVETFMTQSQIQPVGDRVAVDSGEMAIGFQNASFEWSANNKKEASVSSTGSSSTTLALPTEQIPLLAGTTSNECNGTTAVAYTKGREFSLKDITLRFP
ncbi:hypothetical protein GGI12_005934, partial [Dipsacomyces acuminosporus]